VALAAAGPGKYTIGPSLPRWLTAVGAIGGGVAAGALIARMLTSVPPVEAPTPGSAPKLAPEPTES
jgi:hypothetical protein